MPHKEINTVSLVLTLCLKQLLLRGMPHLTKFAPPPKEFRHLTQDPANEPDFHLLHLIAPLPTDKHFGKQLTIDDIVDFCRREGRSETRVLQELAAQKISQN